MIRVAPVDLVNQPQVTSPVFRKAGWSRERIDDAASRRIPQRLQTSDYRVNRRAGNQRRAVCERIVLANLVSCGCHRCKDLAGDLRTSNMAEGAGQPSRNYRAAALQ